MDFSPWMDLIDIHRKRYPQMTDQDVYKLLYQGMLGPKHLVHDVLYFRTNLEAELSGLIPDPCQQLYESVRPDNQLSRVHLRAWIMTGQSVDVLVTDCLKAAAKPWNKRQELMEFWRFYQKQAQPESPNFYSEIEAENFPLVHHSPRFREIYSPAYRLVMT